MKYFKIITLLGLVILFGFGCYTFGFYRARLIAYRNVCFMNYVTNQMYYTMSIDSNKEQIQKKSLVLMEDAIKDLTDIKYFNDQVYNVDTFDSLVSNCDELRLDGCLHSNACFLSMFLKYHPSLKFNETTLNYINGYKFSCGNVPETVRTLIKESNAQTK